MGLHVIGGFMKSAFHLEKQSLARWLLPINEGTKPSVTGGAFRLLTTCLKNLLI